MWAAPDLAFFETWVGAQVIGDLRPGSRNRDTRDTQPARAPTFFCA